MPQLLDELSRTLSKMCDGFFGMLNVDIGVTIEIRLLIL